MRISPVNTICNYKSSPLKSSVKFRNPLAKDTFCASRGANEVSFTSKTNIADKISQNVLDIASRNILSRYSIFKVKDFLQLGDMDYRILKETSKKVDRWALDASVDASKVIEEGFDKKYGKGKYVFVSIGRSLGTIDKALQCRGVETKNLPISGLHHKNPSVEKIISQAGFDKYMDHMEKIGLDKKTIQKSGKQYIFSDFCASGNTLCTFENMMKSDKVGLDLPNVEFHNFVQYYAALYSKMKHPPKTEPSLLMMHFNYSIFKESTSLKMLPYNQLGDIDNAIVKNESYTTKLFDFKLMDTIIGR